MGSGSGSRGGLSAELGTVLLNRVHWRQSSGILGVQTWYSNRTIQWEQESMDRNQYGRIYDGASLAEDRMLIRVFGCSFVQAPAAGER
jgi:hypothetical protein